MNRKELVEKIESEIKSDFFEVDRVTLAGARSNGLVAWDKNCCVLADERGRTINVSAERLVIALGYRRERLAEMEEQRQLFAAAVR